MNDPMIHTVLDQLAYWTNQEQVLRNITQQPEGGYKRLTNTTEFQAVLDYSRSQIRAVTHELESLTG